MTAALLPRTAWTSVPRPVARLTTLNPSEVRGFAVHYTGSTAPLGASATREQSARRLESERYDHVAGRGWSDIAYQAAVDQDGRLFDCRGVRYRCAANGDQDVNSKYGAITWLGGVGDTPTAAAVDAIRWWRTHVWLPLYPRSVEVVGHRDLYSTACPGDPMYRLVRAGAFTSTSAPTEDDMPLTGDDLEKIRALVREEIRATVPSAVWTAGWPAPTQADPKRVETAQDRLVWAARGSAVVSDLDAILGAVRALTADAFADAVAARIPAGGGAPAQQIADAVRDELAAALSDRSNGR